MASHCIRVLIMALWLEATSLSVANGQVACQVMDLAFVIDASGSICDSDKNFDYTRDETCDNWKFVVDFVAKMVEQLTIGPAYTRVAVVTFASQAILRWNLTAYSDKTSLLNAIRTQLTYVKGGTTDTTGGLNVLNTQVFNTIGDRPEINDTAIIITDGKPSNAATVPAAISAVHNSGIRTMVVGVTNQTDELTLRLLSSPPQSPNVTYFWATNFDSIDQVRLQLLTLACSATLPSPMPTLPGSTVSNLMPTASSISSSLSPSVSAATFSISSAFSLPPGCNRIDICLLVDRSGSICDSDPKFDYTRDETCDNWKSVVAFIHNIVNALNVGPNNVRIAVVIFASSSQVAWGLNNYTDKASLMNAIDNLPYIKGGTTDTAGGLRLMNSQVFNTPDDRPDASNVAVIITDGKPTVPSEVPAAIMAAHNSNIRTLAVGVTDSIDEMTVKQLASPPQQLGITYFMATNFRTIDAVRSNLQTQTCSIDIVGTTSISSLPCSNVLDLVFVLDGSGSICDTDSNFVYSRDFTCMNWNLTLQFVHAIADGFNIGSTATRIAMIIFSSKSRLVWGLDAYYDKNSLLYAIDNLKYQKGGTTDTTGALNTVKDEVFTAQLNRPNAQKMAIIITDGKPTIASTVPYAINAVHAKDIQTLVVGVTSQVNVYTLELLSSPPKQLGVTYFMTSDFTTIQEVRVQLLNQVCPTSTLSPPSAAASSSTASSLLSTLTSTQSTMMPTSGSSSVLNPSSTTPSICSVRLDLAFVVDGSGSICDSDPTFNYATDTFCSNWNLILKFMHRIAETLDVDFNRIRVGLVTFASEANLAWNLTAYTTRSTLLAAIDSIPYHKGGRTDTTGGLNLMRTQIFGTTGDRPDVNNTAIIITDGKPTDPTTVQAAVDAVHNAGIKTLVVGVTNATDDATLKQLSSPPQQQNVTYFYASGFDSLSLLQNVLHTSTCS